MTWPQNHYHRDIPHLTPPKKFPYLPPFNQSMKALLSSLFLIISITTHAQTAIGIKGFKYFVSDVTSPQLGNTISGEFVVSTPYHGYVFTGYRCR